MSMQQNERNDIMTALNQKLQEWTARDVDRAKAETLKHYDKLLHSVPNGLSEKADGIYAG